MKMQILVPKLQLLKMTVEPKPPLLKIGIAGQKLLLLLKIRILGPKLPLLKIRPKTQDSNCGT